MFTDTDSLLYEIKTGDVYEDLYERKIKKNILILVITQRIVIIILMKTKR